MVRTREADDGCNYISSRLYATRKLTDLDVWRKARMAIENNRPKAARLAAEIIVGDAGAQISEIQDNAARYLSKRVVAVGKVNKEWVVLALIRMAANDPDAAAGALEAHWTCT